jgi:uncharacterized protein (UPF0276 family)
MTFQPPRFGPGAVYVRSLDDLFWSNPDLIKVAEIEPQSLWTKGTEPGSQPRGSPVERRRLFTLPQRLLTHGVGYPIGGTVCDQERHIAEFRLWTDELSSAWTSEHLSIFHVRAADGVLPCGFLMPPLQTDAQVELASDNIRRRAATLGRPFAFETGVNYFLPRDCEMPDGEFFAAVAEAADCGILLDLTNLWVNHKNGRANIEDVIARLPLERVWEVHLAGIEFAHGYWLDAHCGAIDPELTELAAEIIPGLPNLGAIIFEMAPDRVPIFGGKALLHEIETLHRLWDTTRSSVPAAPVVSRQHLAQDSAPTPEAWERWLANRMLPPGAGPFATGSIIEVRGVDEQSFTLYKLLSGTFRRGAIAELLENTTRLLLIGIGERALRDLLDRYISDTPPFAYPTDEALSFQRFLNANPVPVPGLEDMLKFEATLVESAADGNTIQATFAKDIEVMLGDIAAGRLPGPSSDRETVLEVGVNPTPFIRVPDKSTQAVLPS